MTAGKLNRDLRDIRKVIQKVRLIERAGFTPTIRATAEMTNFSMKKVREICESDHRFMLNVARGAGASRYAELPVPDWEIEIVEED